MGLHDLSLLPINDICFRRTKMEGIPLQMASMWGFRKNPCWHMRPLVRERLQYQPDMHRVDHSVYMGGSPDPN